MYMYLVIGLGNPGSEYTHTRHNVGFLLIDAVAGWNNPVSWKGDRALRAEIAEAKFGSNRILFSKPQTFMNLSGEAVSKVGAYYKLTPARTIVICDDVNLPLGEVRVRLGGGDGGHNGLKSIIEHIGPEFWRIRVGVGAPPPHFPLEKYVLSRLTDEEVKIITAPARDIADYLDTGKLENKTYKVSPSS